MTAGYRLHASRMQKTDRGLPDCPSCMTAITAAAAVCPGCQRASALARIARYPELIASRHLEKSRDAESSTSMLGIGRWILGVPAAVAAALFGTGRFQSLQEAAYALPVIAGFAWWG